MQYSVIDTMQYVLSCNAYLIEEPWCIYALYRRMISSFDHVYYIKTKMLLLTY